jgi:hypothetical protein
MITIGARRCELQASAGYYRVIKPRGTRTRANSFGKAGWLAARAR